MSEIYQVPEQQPNFSAIDEAITQWWREHNTFKKSLNLRAGNEEFVFYDGPPFMSGMPHYATLLSSFPKDVIPRFQTMKGKYVERLWGWDTHGLPIENKVEQQLGLTSRQEIEEHGLADFIAKCYEWNRVGIENWRWYIDKIGRWADIDNAYRTLDQDYMESIWWVFQQLWDKDLIYKGRRTSLYSTDSSTPVSNFEVAMDPDNYRDTVDTAVTVKFKIKESSLNAIRETIGDKSISVFALAWTTTPWTLSSNFALAVNPEQEYLLVEDNGEILIMASSRYEIYYKDNSNVKIAGKLKGTDLVGFEYEQLYNFLPGGDNDFKIYTSEYVTSEDGTGILHVAPAFGEADADMGEAWGLSFTSNIDDAGKLLVGPWQGMYLRDANKDITADLEANGKLFKQEQYTHRLPYYRYANPLIYKTEENYFINVSKLRDQLLASNKEINWIPEHFREGRFAYILETAPDWSISRSRYWGTAMPIWQSKTGKQVVIGSREQLMQLVNADNETKPMRKITLQLSNQVGSKVDADKLIDTLLNSTDSELGIAASQEVLSYVRATYLGETTDESVVKLLKEGETRDYFLFNSKPLDMHRPFIDDVTFSVDGEEYTRIKETLDVWMDSGSMPFAQFHYPFTDKARFEQSFPGDFISEYTGQIRAWFYVLHVLANAVFDKPAFKNVLVTGVLAGTDGRKMSKSFGNYPDPKVTLEKYGAEALRLYFLGSVLMHGDDMNFSEDELKAQIREILIPYWNIYKYFILYANQHGFQAGQPVQPSSDNVTDQWLVALTNKTVQTVDKALETYDVPVAIRSFSNLINETSKWYIRSNRDRFASGDKAVLETLHYAIYQLTLIAAPIIPFTTEHIYRNLLTGLSGDQPESVHLANFPTVEFNEASAKLLEEMDQLRAVIDLGLAARTQNNLKLRQPLAQVYLNGANVTDWQKEVIESELNVKAIATTGPTDKSGWVSASAGDITLWLDTNINQELQLEGIAREVMRTVQAERKRIRLQVGEQAKLQLDAQDELTQLAIEQHQTEIATTTSTQIELAKADENWLEVKGTAIKFKLN